MTNPKVEDDVLTIPEVAAYLKVSEWTVYAHIGSRELKSFDASPGKRAVTRVRRSAVDEFINKREKRRAA